MVLLVVLVSAVGIDFVWEFFLEQHLFRDDASAQHLGLMTYRFQNLLTTAVFVALSLIFPYLIGKRLIEQQVALSNKIKRISEEDYLTGIYNRRKMNQIIEAEIDRCSRYGCNFAVVLCDLDYFKRVNDTYNHLIGDDVLRELSEILARKIRKSDQLARWGGEEFLIFCPQTRQKGAASLAEKLRGVIEQHEFKIVGHLTCSLGIATFNKDEDLRVLLHKVDDALYAAKNSGRNCVRVSSL